MTFAPARHIDDIDALCQYFLDRVVCNLAHRAGQCEMWEVARVVLEEAGR